MRDKHKMVVEFLYKEAMSAKKQQKEKLTNNNKWLFFSPTLPNFKLLLSSKSNQNLPFFPNKIWNPSLSRRVQAYPWKDIWINSLLHSVFCYFLRRQFFFPSHTMAVSTLLQKPNHRLLFTIRWQVQVAGAAEAEAEAEEEPSIASLPPAMCGVVFLWGSGQWSWELQLFLSLAPFIYLSLSHNPED